MSNKIFLNSKKANKKFNCQGNRPRMGKRSMCANCGALSKLPDGILCPSCGKRYIEDVSYDD